MVKRATPKGKLEATIAHFKIKSERDNHIQAYCPAHDDKKASLSITRAKDKLLVFCHAGCDLNDILKTANLTIADLFANDRPPIAMYQYRNDDGSFNHEKLKYPSKKFYQRTISGDGSIVDSIEGITRIPYRLQALNAAVAQGKTILYVEGEKDADTARVLGYTATTMGGASDFKSEYAKYFKNSNIVLIPDKDNPGLKLSANMIDSLQGVVKSLRTLILPDGKDLTEWVEAGNSDLLALIDKASYLKTPEKKKFDWRDYATTHEDLLNKNLKPLSWLVEDILVDVGTGVLAGKKKLGKSFQATQLSQCIASGTDFLGHKVKQGSVVHFALEDGERRTQSRLRMQHARTNLPITYFYKWPSWNTPEGFNQLRDMLTELKPSLVVVDTFAKVLNGKPDQNAASDMADFGNRMHDLALDFNTFFLFIAHHGKGLQMATRDPGFDIRGSSAIPGATDVNIGLYKNEDATYELIGEGRDIAEFDYRVSFDKEVTWSWQLEGEAVDLRREEAEAAIIQAIRLLERADAQAIATQTGTSRPNVNMHLKRIRDYENSPISYEVDGKKIYYSLTTLTTVTDNQNLQHLQKDISVSKVSELSVKNATRKKSLTVSDVSNLPKTDSNQLPDCPKCGTWDWTAKGKYYVCPCGYEIPIER